MEKDTIIRGRVWRIADTSGAFIEDIDTDQIYHNAHLAITDMEKMAPHTFGNLEGWKDFPQNARKGDIVITGNNFGAGSSRQHAVDCFIALGISLIIAGSYGAIYKRNAINSGIPILTHPRLKELRIANGETLEVDLASGRLKNITTGEVLPPADSFSGVQMDIYQAGNLFEYAKSKG